jgi:hypothetical protein
VAHRPALNSLIARLVPVVVLAPAAFAVAGCGLGSTSGTGSGGRVIHVVERDFKITAPAHVRAGHVTVQVHNKGPDAHELIIVRLKHGNRLAVRSDGMSVDEDAVEAATVASLEPGRPGSTRTVRLTLAPGRYEVFCNMSGHFMGGMHAQMVAE